MVLQDLSGIEVPGTVHESPVVQPSCTIQDALDAAFRIHEVSKDGVNLPAVNAIVERHDVGFPSEAYEAQDAVEDFIDIFAGSSTTASARQSSSITSHQEISASRSADLTHHNHLHDTICVSFDAPADDVCLGIRLEDTVCLPTLEAQLVLPDPQQHLDAVQDPITSHGLYEPSMEPQAEAIGSPIAQVQLTEEQQADSRAQDHPEVAVVDLPFAVPAGLETIAFPSDAALPIDGDEASARYQAACEVPSVHMTGSLIPPPIVRPADVDLLAILLGRLQKFIATFDWKELHGALQIAAAHPQGALLVWMGVLTLLLAVLTGCIATSMALRFTHAMLLFLSRICTASSHFTMRRLGSFTRRLLPNWNPVPVRTLALP